MYLHPTLRSLNTCGASVVAAGAIPAGAPIFRIEGTLAHAPGRHTIQVAERVHVSPEGRLWGLMNHSCAPTCFLDFATWTVVTARALREGEEITFHYLTTEWMMAEPFHCACGAPRCLGYIRGFGHLAPAERERLAPYLSPYLLSRIEDCAADLPGGRAVPLAVAVGAGAGLRAPGGS